MTSNIVELILTMWAAGSVRLINRRAKYGLYCGLTCNLSFITYWIINGNYGFLLGEFFFTVVYFSEIRQMLQYGLGGDYVPKTKRP